MRECPLPLSSLPFTETDSLYRLSIFTDLYTPYRRMTHTNIKYGILLSKEQLDFLNDERQSGQRMTAFATFIENAAVEPTRYEKKGYALDLSIGQFAISIVELAKLWKCDRKTATKVVEQFNRMGMLTSETNNRTSVHTLRCLAFWYLDGMKDPVKNPFYQRDLPPSAPLGKSGTDGTPDPASSITDEITAPPLDAPQFIYDDQGHLIEPASCDSPHMDRDDSSTSLTSIG